MINQGKENKIKKKLKTEENFLRRFENSIFQKKKVKKNCSNP